MCCIRARHRSKKPKSVKSSLACTRPNPMWSSASASAPCSVVARAAVSLSSTTLLTLPRSSSLNIDWHDTASPRPSVCHASSARRERTEWRRWEVQRRPRSRMPRKNKSIIKFKKWFFWKFLLFYLFFFSRKFFRFR